MTDSTASSPNSSSTPSTDETRRPPADETLQSPSAGDSLRRPSPGDPVPSPPVDPTAALASGDGPPASVDSAGDPTPSHSRQTAAGSASNTVSSNTGTVRGAIGSTVLLLVRILGDAVILGLWVLLLTLMFLSTGWPQWAFYALTALGAASYVLLTPPWIR